MRNQTKESRRLKDLIRIGVFSALWVVIGFLVAFTIGFFPPILLVLPCVLGIIGGIVYVVMLSKLTIPGGILISSFLLGICLFTMAPYGMMFFCTVAGGVIGEILYSVLGRRTTKATMVGSSFALVGLALGEYIPFIWMQDAYRSMLVNDDSGLLEIAEWCMNIVSVPVMIVLCVATVILLSLIHILRRVLLSQPSWKSLSTSRMKNARVKSAYFLSLIHIYTAWAADQDGCQGCCYDRPVPVIRRVSSGLYSCGGR